MLQPPKAHFIWDFPLVTSVSGHTAVACPSRDPPLPSAYRLSAWGFSMGLHVVTVCILGTVTHSHSSG